MSQQDINSVVASSKECCSPDHDLRQYIRALLISIFDVFGYDPEELAFREGVEEAVKIELDAPAESVIVLDLGSIMLLPGLVESFKKARFAIATQTIGTDFPRESYIELDAILQAGLLNVSDCYAGLVDSPKQVTEVASSSKVLQLRRISGDGALSPRFDYMLEKDSIWAALPEIDNCIKGVIVWDSILANESGYIGDILMPYEQSLPVFNRLSAVVELPDAVGAWLFDWRPVGSDNTKMIDCTGLSFSELCTCSHHSELHNTGAIIEVTNYEIALNRNYCPAYYSSGDYLHARNVLLGTLAEKIQRGTTLSGKDLDVCGTIFKRDSARDESSSNFMMLASLDGPAPLGVKDSSYIIYRDDLWYIDNACIQQDGAVVPKVVSDIPDGQRRYTIHPEDGMCILIPRNGKAVVPFRAKVPTLISNNLFFVQLGTEKEEAEYIDCLVRSSLFKAQVSAAPKPLSKEAVSAFVLPILSKENQADVVKRDMEIQGKIIELQNEIAILEMNDSFDPIEACGIEGNRIAKMKEIEAR